MCVPRKTGIMSIYLYVCVGISMFTEKKISSSHSLCVFAYVFVCVRVFRLCVSVIVCVCDCVCLCVKKERQFLDVCFLSKEKTRIKS